MAAGRAAQEERHERCAEKGKKDVFSFSRGKDWKDVCFALWVETEIGSQRSRPWVWAPPRKRRARGPQHGVETQLVEGRHLGGLWPPFQLIQLIYLRYLCGSTEREKRMDVCFLLTLYIQYITNFGGCQKWKVEENGKDGKIWKARDCGRWICGKGCVGRNGREVRWSPPKVFFLTFLWFYGILTVFSRREQKERNIL